MDATISGKPKSAFGGYGNPEETYNLFFDEQHHTKNKGDLGELKVKVDLLEQGYLILNPETEHAPFDLVIYKSGLFK